jgi:integrase
MVSGAVSPSEHKQRDALLTKLYTTGRLELLRALKRGDLTINELYAADMAGTLTAFAPTDVVLKRPLWTTLDAWQPTCARAPATRTRARVAIRALRRTRVLGDGATVADLATVDWARLRNTAFATHPTSWNHVRRTISRFLTMVLRDKFHEYRRRVLAQWPRAEEPERVPDLPPALFWTILGYVAEPLRPCYVTMVAAGLGPKEFCGCRDTDLLPHSTALRVTGAKVGRQGEALVYFTADTWPWVKAAVPCPVSQGALAAHWKRACRAAGHPELRLYDLRHCYAQWLTNAGVPEWSVQVGMRHKTGAMTRKYAKQVNRGQNAATLAAVLLTEPGGPAVCPANHGTARAG